jgi:hypothetical protein
VESKRKLGPSEGAFWREIRTRRLLFRKACRTGMEKKCLASIETVLQTGTTPDL